MAAMVGAAVVGGTVAALCCCSCCEPKDEWKIDDEIIGNEIGAGFMYKRGKGAAIWSKRYFTLTEHKLCYFLGQDRTVMKGEIILAGCTAQASTSRANAKKKKYFTISHPQCGIREFYAKSDTRRDQWMEKINDISSALSSTAVYGKLYKQGGMSKNVWQERWCICSGPTLDYFEQASDNQSKGSIELFGATVEELKVKDKWCFSVKPSSKNAKKKGDKKYVFACMNQSDVSNWVTAIKRQTTIAPPVVNMNPLNNAVPVSDSRDSAAEVADDDDDSAGGGGGGGGGIAMSTLERVRAISTSGGKPGEHSGYMEKKSPALVKGWQRRWFRIDATGDMTYYKTEADFSKGLAPQGQIVIRSIDKETGLKLTLSARELAIKIPKKTVNLRASTPEEIQEWHDVIESWAMYLSEN